MKSKDLFQMFQEDFFCLFHVWNLPQLFLKLGFTHEQKKREKNNSFRSILDPFSGCHECGYQIVREFALKSWTTTKHVCQNSSWCERKGWGSQTEYSSWNTSPHMLRRFSSPIGLSTSVLEPQVLCHHLRARSDRIWTRGLNGGGYSD